MTLTERRKKWAKSVQTHCCSNEVDHSHYCDFCHRKFRWELQICAKCCEARYCGKKCQTVDWNTNHRKECKWKLTHILIKKGEPLLSDLKTKFVTGFTFPIDGIQRSLKFSWRRAFKPALKDLDEHLRAPLYCAREFYDTKDKEDNKGQPLSRGSFLRRKLILSQIQILERHDHYTEEDVQRETEGEKKHIQYMRIAFMGDKSEMRMQF